MEFSVVIEEGSLSMQRRKRWNNWPACGRSRPALVWFVMLIAIFLAETVIMLLLPRTLPASTPWLAQSAVDAVLLTFIVAPFLWWTVERPLRQLIQIRTQFLASLVESSESLRRGLAHELHDGVGQSVTLLVSGLRSLQSASGSPDSQRRLVDLQSVAQDALNEVRRI